MRSCRCLGYGVARLVRDGEGVQKLMLNCEAV
jgi:hypothetical protein